MMFLQQRLAAGECLVGAGMYSVSPGVVEWVARDMARVGLPAHPRGLAGYLAGIRAAQTRGSPVLIRTL